MRYRNIRICKTHLCVGRGRERVFSLLVSLFFFFWINAKHFQILEMFKAKTCNSFLTSMVTSQLWPHNQQTDQINYPVAVENTKVYTCTYYEALHNAIFSHKRLWGINSIKPPLVICHFLIIYSMICSGTDLKKNIKVSRHWPLWGKFTGNRWISRTKDQ